MDISEDRGLYAHIRYLGDQYPALLIPNSQPIHSDWLLINRKTLKDFKMPVSIFLALLIEAFIIQKAVSSAENDISMQTPAKTFPFSF